MNTTNHKRTLRAISWAAALALPAASALATDGYFPHGYGIKAKGMGGVSIATTNHAFAGAVNPALASFAGSRGEVGLEVFRPDRGASRVNGTETAPLLNGDVVSDSRSFAVPEFGFNAPINNQMAVGVTVYGNGGMNTNYVGGNTMCPTGPTTVDMGNLLCGQGRLGINLAQLIVAPTFSYKVDDRHAIGISPLLVYQRFKAEGLQGFEPMAGEAATGRTTNNGTDTSTGIGVRVGYVGKPTDQLTWGASWSPKTSMKEFDKYAELFAGAGGFDIPENYGVGVAFQATPTLLLGLDYQRINYSDVPSVGNPSTNTALLGSAGGPGFGWSDVNVIKLGVEWKASPQWTLRAGYNKTDNPIQSRDVSFNIIAPGVITKHYTLGATYAMSPTSELSFSFMHAPTSSVSGVSFFDQKFGGQGLVRETIRMSQQSFAIQYGWIY